jgi:dTDP-glucose pyrophosphorylase
MVDHERSESLEAVVAPPELSIADAISQLDMAGTGGLVLCRPDGQVAGLLTDGDIRRAVLRRLSIADPCGSIATRDPVVARAPIEPAEALQLMLEHDINHLPVVDDAGVLIDFLLRKNLVADVPGDLSAVVMAGGFGTRLMPLTETVPKPMLPVGERPMLERTIDQLREAGISEVHLTTHYLPDTIVGHFGDGEAFGVRISYATEDEPMGTAGGLRLIPRPTGPFLVINGDILTRVSYQKMLRFHRKHAATLTVGVRTYEVEVPFGVVECDDARVTDLTEKPRLRLLVNAGIYLLEPGAWDFIPGGQRFDMTDLIRRLLDEGQVVVGYPIIEYWQDVGRHEDYTRAQEDVRDGRF